MQAGLILMNKEKRVDTLEDFMDRVKSLPSQEPYEVQASSQSSCDNKSPHCH